MTSDGGISPISLFKAKSTEISLIFILQFLSGAMTGKLLAAELTLKDAMDRAVQNSQSVIQAKHEYAATNEKESGTWANMSPRVSTEYKEAYFEKEQSFQLSPQAPAMVLRGKVSKTGSLMVAQPITGLYAVYELGKMSGYQKNIAEEGLIKAKRDAAYSAAEAYLQAYSAQEQEIIAKTSLDAAQSQFNDARAIARVGRLNQADLLKFQIALSSAKVKLANSKAAKVIAFKVLRSVLQASSEEEITLQKQLPDIQMIDLKEIKDDSFTKRPEYKQASIARELGASGVKVASAQFVPNVSVFYRIDRNFGELTAMSGEKETKYYGLSLQWDLWTGG
ncbi:MAG: TolC family protein, partial [Oligoflexales bacterium]|nr:TolC family protein [Oligoflexales bacterium]